MFLLQIFISGHQQNTVAGGDTKRADKNDGGRNAYDSSSEINDQYTPD